jgi:hypothetical protein
METIKKYSMGTYCRRPFCKVGKLCNLLFPLSFLHNKGFLADMEDGIEKKANLYCRVHFFE